MVAWIAFIAIWMLLINGIIFLWEFHDFRVLHFSRRIILRNFSLDFSLEKNRKSRADTARKNQPRA